MKRIILNFSIQFASIYLVVKYFVLDNINSENLTLIFSDHIIYLFVFLIFIKFFFLIYFLL